MRKNSTHRVRGRLVAVAALAGLAGLTGSSAWAGLAETQSNYMGPNWTAGWSKIDNWASIPTYAVQSPDGGGDINYIALAHDDNYLYINFNQGSNFAYNYGDENIYFDTDLNAGTGDSTDFWWWGQPTHVGAERSMYGSAIWKTGEAAWDGTSVDNWVDYGPDHGETGDLLIQISLSTLGNPTAFDWAGRMFGGQGADDYYPRSGDYNRYNVTSVSSTLNWNVASGNFTTASNWDLNALPAPADTALIANSGVATVNTSGADAAKAYIVLVGGASGDGTLEIQSGGELLLTDSLRLGAAGATGVVNQSDGLVTTLGGPDNNVRIGFEAGGNGIYNLSGGTLAVGDSLTIGHNGAGTLNMTGGTIAKAGFITVGNNPGASGIFIMSGGTINQTFGDFEVGDEAPGTANISGGTINMPSGGWRFSVGNRAAGNGTANISGSAVINTDAFTAGKAGNGVITISDSALINAGAVTVGHDAGAVGVLNIDGGEINDADDFLIGHNGIGTVNMSGGLVSHTGWIVLGDEVGSAGTMNMTGGTINQTFGDLQVGDAATGVFNLSGTGLVNISGVIAVGNQNGAAGTINQSGGTVNAGSSGLAVAAAAGATGQYNLSGGALNTTSTTINAGGTVNFSGGAFNAGALTVADGQVLLSSGHNKVLKTSSVAVSGAGKIDLADNFMVIDYSGSPGTLVDDTRQLIKNDQITSSAADANHRLGYGDNAMLNKPDLGGEPVDASSILIKYTFGGDANLDGQVDVTDLGALATNWQTSNVWTGGDFNYDGFVDVTDLGILATDWQLGVGSPLGPGSLQAALASVGLGNVAVPEPASIGAAVLCLAGAAWRRRARRIRCA